MREAIELASANASTEGGGPFGAVIVKNGEIIAAAGNSVTPDNDPTAHAEINAIRAASKKMGSWDLTGCQLYTSCEPCPMCLSAAYWAGVDEIYYSADSGVAAASGFDDAYIYEQLNLPKEKRSLPMERLLKERGREPFALWDENPDKVTY